MSENKNIYSEFNRFKQIFLVDKKSIFSDKNVFTPKNLETIINSWIFQIRSEMKIITTSQINPRSCF